jgi:signal transduction histidine kinase
MALLPTDGATAASILDLTELLRGAPPLQLAGLSSSLCHEIRNPLSSVKMAVQTVAKNTGLSERDKRRLAIANREIRTIERMLWLFSEYGREVNFPLELMPLKSVVLEAAALIQLELHERKIELDVQDSTKGCRVRTDPRRLRPVLAQLLLNIAQGLDEGAPLRVELARTDGACELTVEDAAVALPPEEQPTLFEPFGSRLARGAGLSLASLRRVMEDAGGSVRARGGASPPTIFVLHFPS